VAALRKPPSYTQVAIAELIEIGAEDPRVVAITAGMPTGTGLSRFAQAFPDRMLDVGISEQHAITLATGLALGGLRPFVGIYSTFLQRAFDQLVHDACQNDQPIVIGVDRSGLVGEDGTSHQGMFAIPAQRQLPHLVIASPRDEQELRRLLRTAFSQEHPFAIHYPRDAGSDRPVVAPTPIPVGQAELLREGADLLLVGFGPIVDRGLTALDALAAEGWTASAINARFAKPLDRELILSQARGKQLVVTLEESAVSGGFGSAVLELIEEARLTAPDLRSVPVRLIGLPADQFVDHGAVGDLRRLTGLDPDGIAATIREALGSGRLRPLRPQFEARSA
jgi:1-deoxy-D-xylulose-5-phosphate synthase